MSFVTPKRVQFNLDVAKWSGTTPGTKRLPSIAVNKAAETTTDSLETRASNGTAANVKCNASSSENNLIKVGIRVRPANEKELAMGSKNIIKINEHQNEIVLNDNNKHHHKFECDFVITDQLSSNSNQFADTAESQQQYVYECAGKPLLEKAYDGYNVSIFAYGQTGSGKTYSMIGTAKCPGLIPRLFAFN